MYILRVTQLLATFRALGQSGVISLEPMHNQSEESWQAHLQLQQGEVTSCYVQRKSDEQLLFQGGEAIQWLESQENLAWKLDETRETNQTSTHLAARGSRSNTGWLDSTFQPPQKFPQPQWDKQETGAFSRLWNGHEQKGTPLNQVPQRTLIQKENPETLPRDSKRVFALVDGQRNSAQIAALLHYPSQRVAQILRELQAKGLVEL